MQVYQDVEFFYLYQEPASNSLDTHYSLVYYHKNIDATNCILILKNRNIRDVIISSSIQSDGNNWVLLDNKISMITQSCDREIYPAKFSYQRMVHRHDLDCHDLDIQDSGVVNQNSDVVNHSDRINLYEKPWFKYSLDIPEGDIISINFGINRNLLVLNHLGKIYQKISAFDGDSSFIEISIENSVLPGPKFIQITDVKHTKMMLPCEEVTYWSLEGFG